MGTGIGGVTHGEAARRMIHEIRAFAGAQAPSRTLSQVVLTDVDAAMVQAWRGVLSAPE
jgi:O-acetyl-ADP-ribose deacetylase (regulator of RNase III)